MEWEDPHLKSRSLCCPCPGSPVALGGLCRKGRIRSSVARPSEAAGAAPGAPAWVWELPVPDPEPCPGEAVMGWRRIPVPAKLGCCSCHGNEGGPRAGAHDPPFGAWGVFRAGGAPHPPPPPGPGTSPHPKIAINPLLPKLTPPPILQPKDPAENAAFSMGKKHLWVKRMCPNALWGAQGQVGDAGRDSCGSFLLFPAQCQHSRDENG